jgi:hypothetical protein
MPSLIRPRPGDVDAEPRVPARRARGAHRLHVLPTPGGRPLAAVRRTDIQALITASAQRLAPKTVENHLRLIRALFNAAVKDQLLSTSAVRNFSRQPAAGSRWPARASCR